MKGNSNLQVYCVYLNKVMCSQEYDTLDTLGRSYGKVSDIDLNRNLKCQADMVLTLPMKIIERICENRQLADICT